MILSDESRLYHKKYFHKLYYTCTHRTSHTLSIENFMSNLVIIAKCLRAVCVFTMPYAVVNDNVTQYDYSELKSCDTVTLKQYVINEIL